ncbi:MAG TPA: pseudouridine synthase, partial [Polyangiaceae bacterium]|nr:pseudouridine synthase [Polyangiaceae bacterium]
MRWVVLRGHGPTLGDALARAGADPDAIDQGRVFVGRRRARKRDERVREGDVVEIAPSPARVEAARVLFRADDLVAVDKAAGVPTIADHSGAGHALVALTAVALGVPQTRLHPTSRLDRDVSGVVVFALTAAAARRLARARQEGRYERRYVAIAAATPAPARGEWKSAIGRAADPRLRRVGGARPLPACTRYAVGA